MWTTPRTYVAGEIVTASILNLDHRDNLNAIKDSTRVVIVRRTTPVALGASAVLVWESEVVDDWAGHPYGNGIIVPVAGRYRVSAWVQGSGASGSGSVKARIQRLTVSSVFVEDVCGSESGILNGAVSCSGVADCAMNDFFRVLGEAGATGTGHSWTGRFSVEQISIV